MPFEKGQSGNPNGRPKAATEFRLQARRVVDELVLTAWENEVRTMGDDWLKASELLAAYGYGKPSQALEVTGAGGDPLGLKAFEEMTRDEVLEVARSGK